MTYTVLDACCGPRMMWLDAPPGVLFGDVRQETIVVTDRSHGKQDGTRAVSIEPDIIMDFRQMPYPSNRFKLVAFDPPHLERAGPKSWMAAKYGRLSADWRDDIRRGFVECFRVLEPGGVLVFKWNETHVRLKEVLELAPERPLFGQVSGKSGLTHWLVFMKAAPPAIT
jgi:SAM-dependent methyltransferase